MVYSNLVCVYDPNIHSTEIRHKAMMDSMQACMAGLMGQLDGMQATVSRCQEELEAMNTPQ